MNNPRELGVLEASDQALAPLTDQALGLRSALARLRHDLANTEGDSSAALAGKLREANEKLVLAALQAETIAESALNDLDALASRANRDTLTDTPNRVLMLDRFAGAIALARRRGTRLAVVFVDLDGFKHSNDTLGHAVGDDVLKLVARRLESVVRDSDTVSRHGGDEFLVLLAEVTNVGDATRIAREMLSALAMPARVGEHTVTLSASLGIATFPDDGEDPSTLIKRADAAMYMAKRAGGGTIRCHQDVAAPQLPAAQGNGSRAPSPIPRESPLSSQHASLVRDLQAANEGLVIAALAAAHEPDARLEAASRRQILFLAMLIDKLRRPLDSIRRAVGELARARAGRPPRARLQASIEREIARLTTLLDDAETVARAGQQAPSLIRTPVDLARIIEQAAQDCALALHERGQQLQLEVPPGPLGVLGDPLRMTLAFDALLASASAHAAHGGTIVLTTRVDDEVLTITVATTGATRDVSPDAVDRRTLAAPTKASCSDRSERGMTLVRDVLATHGGAIVTGGRDHDGEYVFTLPALRDPTAGAGTGV